MNAKLNREDRIQINLAQITQNPDDTFRVIKAANEIDFTCELCGQKHVSKVYTVRNLNTGLEIRIGCECVKHFNISKSDLDKAEGFLKRVERSIRDSKNELIEREGKKLFDQLPAEKKPRSITKQKELIEALGREYFQSMPLDERSEFYYSAYMMFEAIRMYGGGPSGYDDLTYTYQKGVYIYTKEEITAAVEKIGCADIFAKKIADIDAKKQMHARAEFMREFKHVTYECKTNRQFIDASRLAELKETAARLDYTDNLNVAIDEFHAELAAIEARDAKYPWLFEYTGTNPEILNGKKWLIHSDFSEWNIKKLQNLIGIENGTIKEEVPEIKRMMDKLVAAKPEVDMYSSIRNYYSNYGRITDKQEWRIRHDYKMIFTEETTK